MDPITTAIVIALGNLGQNVIKDAYQALKVAIATEFGIDNDLSEAIGSLEKKPESKGRQETVKEEVVATKADQNPDILKLAETLLEEVKKLEGDDTKSSTVINQQAGDDAIQIGQVGGDANIQK